MTRIAAIIALCAAPAMAENSRVWVGPMTGQVSTLTIHAPEPPAAFATITFDNAPVHTGNDQFVLSYEGITVEITMRHGIGYAAEIIVVTPPDGFVAVPVELTVNEHGVGKIDLYEITEWEGM